MREQKIGALLVVRGEKLIGIITESDIFRTFASIFSSPQTGTRAAEQEAKKRPEVSGNGVVGPQSGRGQE
jgi:acetoin utilization protein AcuB